MRKLIQSVILTSCLACMVTYAWAQAPATVKKGPNGIFLYTGNAIPSGKNIISYKIERSDDKTNWKQIAELKTPASFDAFSKAVDDAKAFFPSQPLPPADKLSQLFQKALASGNTDSLKGMRLLFPVRVALGVMFYDTTAKAHITYSYKISAVKPSGETLQSLLSDTVSLPFQARFDTIRYSESSYNQNSVLVRWKSTGKHPAPLFMVYKFKYNAPVVAHGSTSRFEVNDTTYYTYRDTALNNDAGKEMQYFVSPYDQYGNAGLSSQVAVITQDDFNKAAFVKDHIAFMPKLSGVQICWHFTDPVTVKIFEIYRSETPDAGFRKLNEAPSSDTSYLDQQILPQKTYYYFIQSVAKAGKRTKQSEMLMARVPGMVTGEKLSAPRLRLASASNNATRILVEVNDTAATHLRIFRGQKGGMVVLPVLVKINHAAVIVFTDSTLARKDMKDVFYAVRNEKEGVGISSLSEEMPVTLNTNADEVAYFYAFPAKEKVDLYWDDVVSRSQKFVSYTLARQYGSAGSKSPLKVLAENLTQSTYSDDTAQNGNQYTYVLTMTDKSGASSAKSWKITTQQAK